MKLNDRSGADIAVIQCRITLGPDDRFEDAGVLPRWLGRIYDQDSIVFPQVQAGLREGGNANVIYSRYQEVRIRHLHQTLSRYVQEFLRVI